ncbi:TniQ family protein [Ramlibacter sp. AN1015]|uniref:TniQ family protein n=1 Tax=Ramlibacter sp. AN1015 TaxID=3133428 RepID=UPI0030C52270
MNTLGARNPTCDESAHRGCRAFHPQSAQERTVISPHDQINDLPMLSFAPPTVNDELLYSYVSRWFVLAGYKTASIFSRAAFGADIAFHLLNAQQFTALQWRGGAIASDWEVTETMTLVPFARMFLGQENCFRFIEPGVESRRDRPPIALTRSPWRLQRLKYCPHCAEIYRQQLGRGAWLRPHHLPGVTACHLHEVKLVEQPFCLGTLEVVPHDAANAPVVQATEEELWYARVAARLLYSGNPVISFKQWQLALASAFDSFCKSGQWRTRRDELADAVTSNYSDDFLAGMGINRRLPWQMPLDKLFDSPLKELNPIYMILLARFLLPGGIEELIRRAQEFDVPQFKIADLERKRKDDAARKRERERRREFEAAIQRAQMRRAQRGN